MPLEPTHAGTSFRQPSNNDGEPAVLLSLPEQKCERSKSMAKTNSATRDDDTMQSVEVSDQTVSQVGKAVVQILKLRQSMEENMSTVRTDEERQSLADEVESAALVAISDQGLTVAQYNHVIAAAQEDNELEERVLVACRAS
jgi:hypothetical protein